jgi:hypothetical protein
VDRMTENPVGHLEAMLACESLHFDRSNALMIFWLFSQKSVQNRAWMELSP